MTMFRSINEVGIAAHDEFRVGQRTVGTTAVQLVTDDQVVQGIVVKAHADNLGRVYVGTDADVSAAVGFPLEPSESVSVPINNANKVWLIGNAPDLVVAWLGA